MHHRLLPCLVLVASLAACKAPAPTEPKPTKSAGPAVASSAKPAKAAALLKPLDGKVAKISGQVFVDALYATSTGGATRLAGGVAGADGATLITNDGGSIISNDGASLVAGGQIVAQGGGNVIVPAGIISNDGASLITNDGGSIISNDGASVISRDGAGVVSRDGAGVISRDGAGYQLAQADAAPAYGDSWPAAGMWLSVVDQRTGLTVPIGQDDAGKDVYTVYTNATGKFEVAVAADVAPYVRVVARAPGRVDRRMVVQGLDVSGRVDEDSSAVDAFTRFCVARQMLGIVGVDLGDGLVYGDTSATTNDAIGVAGQLALAGLRRTVKDLGVANYSPAKKLELGLLMADAMLVAADYRHLTFADDGVPFISPQATKVLGKNLLAELRTLLQEVRQATANQVKGQADPVAFFAGQKYLIAANLGRPAETQYQIRRPADMADFLVREYLSRPQEGQTGKAFDVLHQLGLPDDAIDRLGLASRTLIGAALKTIVTQAPDGASLNDKLAELVTRANRTLATADLPTAVPEGTPRALPPAPAAEPMEVTLIAGTPGQAAVDGGPYDGPGLHARFAVPQALAVGPDHALYVADHNFGTVRRLRFDAAGAVTVETVINASKLSGYADGPGDKAQLNGPTGLAFDQQGRLYIMDALNFALRRASFDASGKATVETLFGGPSHTGDADGANGSGGITEGAQIVVAADGSVVAAQTNINALRVFKPGGAGWAISTLGRRQPTAPIRWEGLLGDAGFSNPTGVAFDATGRLWVTDSGSGVVRQATAPLGPEAVTRLVAGGRARTDAATSFFNAAWMDHPAGIAIDAQGRAVVADGFSHRILRVQDDGWVQVLAGGGEPGKTGGGFKDGVGAEARFQFPWGVAVDGDTIYVSELANHVIRRLRPAKR